MPLLDHRRPIDLMNAAGRLRGCAAALAIALAAGPAFGQIEGRDPMGGGGLADDAVVEVSEHDTIDLHAKDEQITSLLEMLSIQTNKNIIASNQVTGTVTARLQDVTFYEALDAILHVNGFGYIEKGNFIYVYTQAEIEQYLAEQKQVIAKVVRLSYLNADDAQMFVTPLLSEKGAIQVNQAAPTFNIPDDVPTGAEDFALASTLVIIDYEENVEQIEVLLSELDTRPAQVLVEATILQSSLSEANAFGVDFTILGDIDFDVFSAVGGPLSVADALINGGSGTDGGVSPADNQAFGVTSSAGNTAGPATLKVGVISDDVSIFMRLLDEVSDTTIISNPKVLTLNRQPARVLVGRRVGYLSTTSTETSTQQTLEFLPTGTQLVFRPFVSKDGEIRMELKPSVSEAIIREATDITGTIVTIPDEVTQELVTNVIVRDGQTIVLGGLFRESTRLTRRQVPFLGDIPIVGSAFRGHDDTVDRSEVIFMITPSIVSDSMIAGAAGRAEDEIERLRAGTRQGLLPWSRDKMTAALNVEAERLAREGDYSLALWHVNRSLAMKSLQPDALRLRERITGMRDLWPSRRMLDYIIDPELEQQLNEIEPQPLEWKTPYGSFWIPLTPIDGYTPPVEEPAGEPSSGRQDAKQSAPLAQQQPADESYGPMPMQGAARPQSDDTVTLDGASESAPLTSAPDDYVWNSAYRDESAQGERFSDLSDLNAPQRKDPLLEGLELTSTVTLNDEPWQFEDPNGADNTNESQSQTPPDAYISQADRIELDEAQDAREALRDRRVAESLKLMLPALRGQIEFYRDANDGASPDFANRGWAQMIEDGLLDEIPTNPLAADGAASIVSIGDGPFAATPDQAGWVYDPETSELWAVGLDEDDRFALDRARQGDGVAGGPAFVEGAFDDEQNNAFTGQVFQRDDEVFTDDVLSEDPNASLADAVEQFTMPAQDEPEEGALSTLGDEFDAPPEPTPPIGTVSPSMIRWAMTINRIAELAEKAKQHEQSRLAGVETEKDD